MIEDVYHIIVCFSRPITSLLAFHAEQYLAYIQLIHNDILGYAMKHNTDVKNDSASVVPLSNLSICFIM